MILLPIFNVRQFREQENAFALRFADGFHDPNTTTLTFERLHKQAYARQFTWHWLHHTADTSEKDRTILSWEHERRRQKGVLCSLVKGVCTLQLLFHSLNVLDEVVFASELEMILEVVYPLGGNMSKHSGEKQQKHPTDR
jgi:hypothetical protein